MEQSMIQHLLEAAEQCQGDESVLMPVIDKLERHRSKDDDSPALQYACAYAWYLHPRRLEDTSIQRRVDELLHQVLKEIPSDYLSLLYLGHNKYDCQDYATAHHYFERAKSVAPKNYIGLKAYEMLVCSKIMEAGVGEALDDFETFVREASDSSYEKEDIWPRELASALKRRGRGDLSAAKLAKAMELAERLDQVGQLNGWLREVIRGM